MTADEEIQAAIEKLTGLKNEPIVTALFTATVADAEWFSRTSKKLAIFHRTIDAQLVLLRESLDFYENSQAIGMPDSEMSEYYGATHALARAINGPIS